MIGSQTRNAVFSEKTAFSLETMFLSFVEVKPCR